MSVPLLVPGKSEHSLTNVQWKKRAGDFIKRGEALCVLQFQQPDTGSFLQQILKAPVMKTKSEILTAPYAGTIEKVLTLAESLQTNVLCYIHKCTHSKIADGYCTMCDERVSSDQQTCKHEIEYYGICGNCGQQVSSKAIKKSRHPSKVSVGVLSNNIHVSPAIAEMIETNYREQLVKEEKLLLILDLDHTLLHTTAQRINDPGTQEFCIENNYLTTKFRPHLEYFLENIRDKYEMCVYTMGSRPYAQAIIKKIDPEGNFFGTRIISRDDNPSERVKSLHMLLPSNHDMMVILDDTHEVWPACPNLVIMERFIYFPQNTDPISSKFTGENDILLRFMTELLIRIHQEFFRDSIGDVTTVIKSLQAKVLQGITLTLDNPLILDLPQEFVHSFGAQYCPDLTPQTKYLITENPNSELSIQAKQQSIPVLHKAWLERSINYWYVLPIGPFAIDSIAELDMSCVFPCIVKRRINSPSPDPYKKQHREEENEESLKSESESSDSSSAP